MNFYFNLSPNPTKVLLALEEMGVDFRAIPVEPRRGEQFRPEYLAINPNAKVPAIVDGDTTVFDSNAILLYLSEKTGRFGEADAASRGEFLSWLMFVATGIGPYSGQAVHFRHYAPEGSDYGANRYGFEADRHYRILDERLSSREFLVAGGYSIVDMAAWGWTRMVPFILGDDAWSRFPHLKRHHDAIAARPAGRAVEAFRAKHGPVFQSTFDAEARRNMFRHLASAS